MALSTKWIVGGVLAAGLLTSAVVIGTQSGSRSGVITQARPGAVYEDVYRLEPGENLKVVEPPFIQDRQRLYEDTATPSRVGKVSEAPGRMLFDWDGDRLQARRLPLDGFVAWGWFEMVRDVLGLEWYEVDDGGLRLMPSGEPLRRLAWVGDWVVREGGSSEERIEAFSGILNQKLHGRQGAALRFERKRVERDVVLVEGGLKFRAVEPRDPGGGRKPVSLFATSDPPREWGPLYDSSVEAAAAVLGRRLGAPLMIEGGLPFTHWRVDADLPPAPLDRDTLRGVVKNLERQTGLDLRIERRTLEVWVLVED